MKKTKGFALCFIGKHIKVIESPCKPLVGLEGDIINETKNTFCVKTSSGEKIIVKNQIDFIVDDNEKEVIQGKDIMKKPEDRLKMRIKNE